MTSSTQPTSIGRVAWRFFAGLCSALAIPLILAAQWPFAPAVVFFWDFANALGFLGLACCMLLFVYAGKPREFPAFSGRFFANLHRHLGYAALLLVLAHVLILLIYDPLLLEHLKPTAPGYMLAGLMAAVLLLLIVGSSMPSIRRRLWRDYRRFRVLHACLSVVFVALCVWHILGSAYYLNTSFKLWLACLIVLGLVTAYLTARSRLRRPAAASMRVRDTAIYSHRIAYGALLVVVVLVAATAAIRAGA